ncbi:putative co-chaperonin GroES [Campylobacter phage PC5]|uniref:Putative co-chaperonin GroES n=1 Tax=Campylobacter phage PC5 TaxID=1541690 RepID=A0A1B0XVQ8_9CAUD|nr:putative co-chaperonin GroES [Campylobacter phage PC5]
MDNFDVNSFKIVHPHDVLLEVAYPSEIKSESGIIVTVHPSLIDDRQTQGKVLQIGSEVKDIEIGDTVVFGKQHGIDLHKNDKVKYMLIRDESLMGILR